MTRLPTAPGEGPHVPEAAPVPATTARPARVPGTVVALLSIAVAVYFPLQYLADSLPALAERRVGLAPVYAGRPWPVQVAFYAHITFAGLALLLGPLQFSSRVRERWPRLHRVTGRGYITCCLVGGVAAFVMSFASSVGLLGFFGFGSLAVLWVVTTVNAYRAIRRGDVASHRAWMMRSFALTFAAPTLRLWLFVLLLPQVLFFGVPADAAYTNAYAPVPFLSWIPNLVVAELLVRRRGLPALRMSPAGG